jgi:hypothetical protein
MNKEELFKKNFPGAQLERIGLSSWRINTRTGFVEYNGKTFTRPVGGYDLYRGIALSTKDMGYTALTVDGTEQHIVATTAACAEVGIDVIPEINKKNSGCLTFIAWLFLFGLFDGISTSWLDDRMSFWAGITGASLIMLWISPMLDKRAERAAMLRGQIYRNPLPDIHGDVQHPVRGDEIGDEHYGPRA